MAMSEVDKFNCPRAMVVAGRCLAIALLWATTGCINTDAAVFVEAKILNPEASLQQSSLTAAIEGSFALALHLGPRATAASEVSLSAFSITDAARESTLLAPLAVQAVPAFPVSVGIDSDVEVSLSFAADDNLLPTDGVDALCDAAGIVLLGVLDDGLRDRTISVASEPFSVVSCP